MARHYQPDIGIYEKNDASFRCRILVHKHPDYHKNQVPLLLRMQMKVSIYMDNSTTRINYKKHFLDICIQIREQAYLNHQIHDMSYEVSKNPWSKKNRSLMQD